MPSVASEGSSSGSAKAASVALTSLVPRYDKGQHETYLKRLEEAARKPKNLNIALTGRYGAGKSSVLDEFARDESRSATTLRLAISTLGPNDEGATLTNRIQKELVKQVVYSASTPTLRRSRFRRSVAIPWSQAAWEAAAAVGVLGVFLALMGWLPTVAGTGPDHLPIVRVAAWALLAVLLTLVGTVLRIVTHDRFVVTDVSAGGAAVKLSERTPSYFDEYLDDIVNYFDTEDVNIVVFEDLDRFDDPHIFEALRELNTLLNSTKKRLTKGISLQFVYAVRDSLFEKLGSDTQIEVDDDAFAETVRANRTKFFDVVIPMVPFISHRNARDLLIGLLKKADINGIERRLIGLVARHCTDMRLLHNICNEYLVFAERLLESGKVAPGLTPNHLFALVAYKNFHLTDFEKISRKSSDLDTLYDFRRDLVRDSIATLQTRKRALVSGKERLRTRNSLAEDLGKLLNAFVRVIHQKSQYSGWPYLSYHVDGREFPADGVGTYEFWQAAADVGKVTVQVAHSPGPSRTELMRLTQAELAALTQERMEPARWAEIDEEATRSLLAQIEKDINTLRRADFADLAAETKYTIQPIVERHIGDVVETQEPREAGEGRTFGSLVDETLRSELARDMVKGGHIDRNFALYAAQFYGNFTGTDVATFVVQNVQSNTMEIDYAFTSPGAVANLLDEADDDFTHTIAAYNIDVLDYLLKVDDRRADHIVDQIVTDFDDNARTFLSSYLTSGSQGTKLVARLTRHGWHDVFSYLVNDSGVPDDARPALVSSALCTTDIDLRYTLTHETYVYIAERYLDMPAFVEDQSQSVIEKVLATLDRAKILIPRIEGLHEVLREVIVDSGRYELTAANLRTALDPAGTGTVFDIALDSVQQRPVVYERCLAHPNDYLAAVERDAATLHTISTPQTLATVLSDVAEKWEDDQIAELVNEAAPGSRLASLSGVPRATWPALASAKLFRASLANLEDYRTQVGVIDRPLAELLEDAGVIFTSEPGDFVTESGEGAVEEEAAIAVLNATTISDPATRVSLVNSLSLEGPLQATDISPEPSLLFGLLLEHDLVADDAASFTHFQVAGWAAIGPAIAVSQGVLGFLTPDMVRGMVAELLSDDVASKKLGPQIASNIDDFIPDDDGTALAAVAQYADDTHTPLTPETVLRIARATALNQQLVLRLAHAASPPANAPQIVSIFTVLGAPYDLLNRPGATFDVERDVIHTDLLTRLKDGNICTFVKRRNKEVYAVDVN